MILHNLSGQSDVSDCIILFASCFRFDPRSDVLPLLFEKNTGFSGTHDTPAALDHAIIVANKADLLQAEERIDDTLDALAGAAAHAGSSGPRQTAGAATRERQRGEATDGGLQEKPTRIWRISCRTRQGVDDFVNHLEEEVSARFQISGDDESPLITRWECQRTTPFEVE